MKAKITKRIKHLDGKETICESLYNFPTMREARMRLQSIKNACRYPIIETDRNFFKADKYGDIYLFSIEKSK